SAATVKVKLSQVDPVTHQVTTAGWAQQQLAYQAVTTASVPTAAQTRNDAVNGAQQTYNQSLATANSNYLASLATAASTLQTDLARTYANRADRAEVEFQPIAER